MTKLCPRGKAAAKRKFKVYPSAYANAYASKICAGKIKDPSGVKRKDFRGPKPAKDGKFFTKPGMQTRKGSGKNRFKPTQKVEKSEDLPRNNYKGGGPVCKLATKGKGRAYGKNS